MNPEDINYLPMGLFVAIWFIDGCELFWYLLDKLKSSKLMFNLPASDHVVFLFYGRNIIIIIINKPFLLFKLNQRWKYENFGESIFCVELKGKKCAHMYIMLGSGLSITYLCNAVIVKGGGGGLGLSSLVHLCSGSHRCHTHHGYRLHQTTLVSNQTNVTEQLTTKTTILTRN